MDNEADAAADVAAETLLEIIGNTVLGQTAAGETAKETTANSSNIGDCP